MDQNQNQNQSLIFDIDFSEIDNIALQYSATEREVKKPIAVR